MKAFILIIILVLSWYVANYGFPTPSEGEEITIKIASFNVHGLPLIDRTRRMTRIADKLQEFDVVGIQEAWTRKSRRILSKNFPYIALGNVSKFPRFGDGLMILSKFPIHHSSSIIRSPSYISYDGDSAHAERFFARKGAMKATIQIENFEIDFYNTHLQSQKGRKHERIRRSQLIQFLIYMDSGNSPKIITGDFNIPSETKIVPLVLRAIDGMRPEESHIDYILYRENKWVGIIKGIQNKSFLSDHPIIEAVLTLKQKP